MTGFLIGLAEQPEEIYKIGQPVARAATRLRVT